MADFVWLALLVCTLVCAMWAFNAIMRDELLAIVVSLVFVLLLGYATSCAYTLGHPPAHKQETIVS